MTSVLILGECRDLRHHPADGVMVRYAIPIYMF